MENWLFASLPILLKTVATTWLILLALLIVVRIYGLRSLAKMSSVDFASTLATGSVLASTIMSTETSVTKGCIAILAILGFQQLFSMGKRQFKSFEAATENTPRFLMIGTEIIEHNMKGSGVTHSDLMAKLREANVYKFSQVKVVVLETTGDVTVLHADSDDPIDDAILAGVKK